MRLDASDCGFSTSEPIRDSGSWRRHWRRTDMGEQRRRKKKDIKRGNKRKQSGPFTVEITVEITVETPNTQMEPPSPESRLRAGWRRARVGATRRYDWGNGFPMDPSRPICPPAAASRIAILLCIQRERFGCHTLGLEPVPISISIGVESWSRDKTSHSPSLDATGH